MYFTQMLETIYCTSKFEYPQVLDRLVSLPLSISHCSWYPVTWQVNKAIQNSCRCVHPRGCFLMAYMYVLNICNIQHIAMRQSLLIGFMPHVVDYFPVKKAMDSTQYCWILSVETFQPLRLSLLGFSITSVRSIWAFFASYSASSSARGVSHFFFPWCHHGA